MAIAFVASPVVADPGPRCMRGGGGCTVAGGGEALVLYLPYKDVIRGFVYDVEIGRLDEINVRG
ncbi:hypothetical protein [Nonomuraea rhizosphaerae]|uniref:hypothetical protein n=1 Tax=Nonomuraea rhizosphaerae TaxID=2665663 RepID=UPI001C5E812F|nr:hypothetical protein [Nonomuraea rhizosphaerae]